MDRGSWSGRVRTEGPYPSGRPVTMYRREDMLFRIVQKYLPAKKLRPRSLVDINQNELISDFGYRYGTISSTLKEYEGKDLGNVLGPEFKGLKIYATPKKFVLDDDIGLVSHRTDGKNMVLCTRCGEWAPMPDSNVTTIYCSECGCMGFIVSSVNGGMSPLWPLLTGLAILTLSLWPSQSEQSET